MFLWICALTLTLPKRKEISADFFIEQLVKNNQQMQALKADYDSKKKSRIKAFSKFLPKVRASAGINRTDDMRYGEIKKGDWWETSTGKIEAEWNVFNSFGDVADLKSGKAGIESEKYSYYKQVSKLFLEALDSLLKINTTLTNLEVTHSSADGRERIYHMAHSKWRNKAIALGEFKHAEAQWENMKYQQYDADAQYQGAIAEFISYTGIPVENIFIIGLPSDLPKNYEEAETLMLKNNFEIQSANHKVEQAKADLIKAKSQFGPKVSLSGNVNHDFDHEEKKLKNKYWSGGAEVSINLFNGFSDIADHQAQSKQLTAARCNLQAVLSFKRAELKTTWATYRNALEQKVLAERALAAFEIVAKSAEVKFESGAKDVSSTVEAQDQLANAKNRYAENEKVLRLSAWRLKILVGDIKSILQKLEQGETL